MRPPFSPCLFALIIALLAPLSRAAEPAPAPAPAKADDIPALIKQLGDDSPKVRDAASQQLRQLGTAALPALTEAQKSDDPEVANRAQTISRQIADDRNPAAARRRTAEDTIAPFGIPGGGIGRVRLIGPGGGAVAATKTVRISRGPDGTTSRLTTVNEGGQRITINENAEGIAVTTTKTVDGKDVEETVKARDKETLQKEHPDAFALYDRHTKQTVRMRGAINGGVEIGGLNAAEQAQAEAALRRAREMVDQQLQQNAAGGEIDPKAQAELEKALEEARAMALEHRKQAEEQFRITRQQILETRRQIEEARRQQLEEIQRQREQQLKENRRAD